MKNNSSKIKELLMGLAILMLFSFCIYLVYTVDKLQDQVFERDILLEEQSERENKSKMEYNNLINSLNQLFGDADIESEGEFDVSKFIQYHNNLKGTISQLKTNLELIESNYGITTTSRKRIVNESRTTTTTSIIGSEKVDSALVLLPYFRDRLTKMENGNWTISLTGQEYEKIKKNYEDKMYSYNSLADNYNNLLKDYNDLVVQYNSKVDFYRNMLINMSKKGLVTIDSSGADIIYTYK